jgi:CrcB protein
MTGAGFLAVGVGAALGAWLRWMLNIGLNTVLPNLALGTLASNLIGGYLIGAVIEYFFQQGAIPLELRLFIITGFLGGLTTFSSFSAEAAELLMRAQYGWVALLISSHVIGSIAMTFLGIFTVRALAG